MGKVSPGFQVKSEAWLVQHALRDQALKEGWRERESDHAKISQFTVQELLRTSQLHRWAAVVGAHHGRIKGERVQVREPWEEERVRLAEELIKEFGPLPDQPPSDAQLWFVAGLITIADWIGSDETTFPTGCPLGHAGAAQASTDGTGDDQLEICQGKTTERIRRLVPGNPAGKQPPDRNRAGGA